MLGRWCRLVFQNSTENGERSVLTLGPSAYPSVCGIQREAD